MDTKDDVVTLSNWKRAVELRKQHEAGLKELTAFETKLAKTHREQHPLSPQTIKDIMDIFIKLQIGIIVDYQQNFKTIW